MNKERPILFSGEMVRAILEGRKTQTRRIIKNKDFLQWVEVGFADSFIKDSDNLWQNECPYGQPGDRLWVRETFEYRSYEEGYDNGIQQGGDHDWEEGYSLVGYKADNSILPYELQEEDYLGKCPKIGRWYPSIHMPRWASRILLEITDIRVERLQDITEEDAKAEGIYKDPNVIYPYSYVEMFSHLWEAINGAESWNKNPWVWVIEFRRIP